jgi:hypothetical protein
MTNRKALAAGVALAAFVLSNAGAQAAATHHRKHVAAAPSKESAELKQEVNDLKAQLAALTARLDAQAAAQQQTQTQAQAAASQAQAAASQAQSAATTAQAAQTVAQEDASKIETLPNTIEAEAKAKKGGWFTNGWWDNTRIGATMFADVTNITNRANDIKTPQSGTDYDIKRLYLTVEHSFNAVYSFQATTDFVYDTNTGPGANTQTGTKSTQLFIKKAYLQANYIPGFNVRLGAADLPWVPYVESLYGYRYVENVLIDRTKFGTSTDWGVHAYGSFYDNHISYAASVVDGEGYKSPAIGNANRTDAVDYEGRISASYNHFNAAIGGYTGKLGNDVSGVQTYQRAERFDALVAYVDGRIRLGGEYFWARYWKDVLQPIEAKTNVSDGYSIFGSYNFTPKVAMFARYDWVKPLADTAPGETDNFYNIGVSYKPIAPLDFALVYKHDSVFNGSFSTADGVIGIPSGAKFGRGLYDEFGLFTQVKF